jgi:hypothetical protein
MGTAFARNGASGVFIFRDQHPLAVQRGGSGTPRGVRGAGGEVDHGGLGGTDRERTKRTFIRRRELIAAAVASPMICWTRGAWGTVKRRDTLVLARRGASTADFSADLNDPRRHGHRTAHGHSHETAMSVIVTDPLTACSSISHSPVSDANPFQS